MCVNPTAAFHERDLAAFRDKLLEKCPPTHLGSPKDYITFRQAMLMKSGGTEIKAAFVSAILDQEIKSFGNVSGDIGGMVFSRAEVESFMRVRKYHLHGLKTVVDAARFLHCDPAVVKNLYCAGRLAGEQQSRGLFIRESSLKVFADRYVSCASVAKANSTNSNKVVRFCKLNQIMLHSFPRPGNQSPQPFIERQAAKQFWNIGANTEI